MLLSEALPPLHADIIAVRGHTAVSGHVTEVANNLVQITLPADGEASLAPTFDLWVRDNWDWENHSDRVHYEFPIPAPDLSFLTIRPTDAA